LNKETCGFYADNFSSYELGIGQGEVNGSGWGGRWSWVMAREQHFTLTFG